VSIERPNAYDEPDFCRGSSTTLARIAELTESHDNLTRIIEALQEAHGWATVEGIHLHGDLKDMIKAVKLARCSICRQVPSPECDWRQGRCPHRDPAIGQTVIRIFSRIFKWQRR
jgi:hypothetical protein